MADIELVIKIDEGIYRRATRDYLEIVDLRDIRLAIINGKPLPKGHGNLVDLEELTHEFWDGNYMEIHKDDLSKIKAIIPAESDWYEECKK